jgi:transketolase C-terminal domain/subunit
MEWLGTHDKTIFIGHGGIEYPGNPIFDSMKGVPEEKKLELPVCEELQMGMSLGLALEGYIPISIYPRFDFLILALNQLVNHIDKISVMTEFSPTIIIRTQVGNTEPIDGGCQHTQDHSEAIKLLCPTLNVVNLKPEYKNMNIKKEYQNACIHGGTSLFVEYMEFL